MSEKELITLVTGASFGLGRGIALEAAKSGHHVIALGRTQSALDTLGDQIEEFGGAITVTPMDITDDQAMAYLAKSIAERWGKLDYWIHTAWYQAPMQPTPHLLPKDLDKTFNTNIRATARLIAILNPLLREAKGNVIAFNQLIAQKPHMAHFHYPKYAQMALFEAWAEESQKIAPKIDILTPKPMNGIIRSSLYPGEDRNNLASPLEEAKRLWSEIIS